MTAAISEVSTSEQNTSDGISLDVLAPRSTRSIREMPHAERPRERMRAVGERPQHGDFELADARVIAPGAANRSVIVPRVAMRGPGQMPPVGTRVPDAEGVQLLMAWIESMRK